MINFFKKKQNIPKITFWPTVQGLDDVVPVQKSIEYIPDWWKNSQNFITGNVLDKGTVRHCPSFPELFRMGYVIPLWCDLYIKVDENGILWKSPDKRFQFEIHKDEQYRNLIPPHARKDVSIILKTLCPWRLKTSPGYSVLQVPMFYHFNEYFEALPGVIWTDIHHEINQQIIIKKFGEFIIQRGTPLVTYIPYKREEIQFECIPENEQLKRSGEISSLHFMTKFIRGYKLQQNQIKKCPFTGKKSDEEK